jgi:hypothetical protein
VASLGCYGIAKLLEMLDGQIYDQLGVVSGHTLKHLVAGLGAWFVLLMLQRRQSVARSSAAALAQEPRPCSVDERL